jgi:hypothetical protein
MELIEAFCDDDIIEVKGFCSKVFIVVVVERGPRHSA